MEKLWFSFELLGQSQILGIVCQEILLYLAMERASSELFNQAQLSLGFLILELKLFF